MNLPASTLKIHPANRLAAWVLAVGLIGTAVLAILPALNKPFTLDETEIAYRAHFIVEKGPRAFVDGSHYLAHPPLYEYTIAALFKIFGESEFPSRFFGLLLFLITGIFFKMTLDELLRNEDPVLRSMAVYAGLLLYAVNPLLVQHALVLDADTTGTALFTMILTYFFIRMEMRDSADTWGLRAAQALALALIFLSKEVTPVFIFAGVAVYRLAGCQWKKFLRDVVTVFVPGLILAWGVWWIYCLLTGTDVMVFLKYTWLKKGPRALNPEFLAKVVAGFDRILRWPAYWVSTPFFVLLILAIVRRATLYVQTQKTRPEDFLWIVAMAVWTPYLLVKGSIDMMKYQHPVYPLFIACIVSGAAAYFRPRADDLAAALRDAWWAVPLAVVAMIGLVWVYAQMGDYILYQWDVSAAPRYKQFLNHYYRPIAVAVGAVTLLWVLGRLRLIEGIVAASLLFCLPINAALNLNQTAEYVTAESWMNYGESGHRETVNYLSLIAEPKALVSVREDLLYYLRTRKGLWNLRTVPLRDLLVTKDLVQLERFLASGSLEVVELDRLSILGVNAANGRAGFELFHRYYYLDREFGSFKIYRPRKRGI